MLRPRRSKQKYFSNGSRGLTGLLQVQTLEQLLQGFDEEDPDMAARALNSSFIKHMDIEYAKLARSLPLPKGTAPLSSKGDVSSYINRPSIFSNFESAHFQEGAGASRGFDEDEDGGLGLC